ncbi:MNIO family bufferin maturase [Ancylobacter terrae]|uniref:MNIO family bufferin maturase n=1 Tax=Ancylobacter sp. sgz301288 TaxID=3342077 RepID=UPI00385807A8
MTATDRPPLLPAGPGVGVKPEHVDAILADEPSPLAFIEVHAENYMGEGGRPHVDLAALRERFALSIHGVGLSIGGEEPLDAAHLARLRRLIDCYRPESFSEHLAWSTHGGAFFNDLLPLPYTPATLARVGDHILQVQDTLGRRMLLENPSTYLRFAQSTIDEVDFLAALASRTGCGLLLDVNNVFVSAVNHGIDARAYLARFPMEAVGEIHLGGHDEDADETGAPLLIDAHGSPVADPVWTLFAEVIARTGPLPSLIEWDNDVPDWPVLRAEAARAGAILARHARSRAA